MQSLIETILILVSGLLVATGTLFTLRRRDRRVERRETQRLERLADASSRLTRLRSRDDVLRNLLIEIGRCLPTTSQCLAPGQGLGTSGRPATVGARRLHTDMVNDAGVLLGTIAVELRRRIHPGDQAALMQLTESATAALETIALLESAEVARLRTEAILASMSDAMLAFDGIRRLTFVNPNGAVLLGHPPAELLGSPLEALLPAGIEADTRSKLMRLVEGDVGDGDRALRLFWPAMGDGDEDRRGAWVQARAFHHLDGVTLYMQDVTRQVETEEQLRQTAKMDAVGQLTGGIAHDFNNLLTVILGNLEILEEVTIGDPQALELVRLAQRAGQNASSLTSRLLAFARRQPLQPADIDVVRLLSQIGELMSRTLGPGVAIQIEAQDARRPARADPVQLETAIINLAINARDAMRGGGTLTLRAIDRDVGSGDLADGLPPGEYATITVTDTGCGMSADTLTRAFEPFFSTKPPGSGTGLGLSMVYGFARQSGGIAAIVSEQGVGTTVSLTLPRGTVQPLADLAPASTDGAPRGQHETILLVEDEPLVRRFVTNTLEDLGYEVFAFRDGAGALDMLGRQVPDLIVSDVALPGELDGEHVALAARAMAPKLPVIFISGFMDHELLGNVIGDENMSFIRKPFSRSALAIQVRHHLAGARFTDVGHQH